MPEAAACAGGSRNVEGEVFWDDRAGVRGCSGCRVAFGTSGAAPRGFRTSVDGIADFRATRGVFRISSRRGGGVGGRTHRDEGPSKGLVGLLLLDRLGGEENFAVERAAAARVLGRAAVVAAAGVRGARAVLHIRPGDRGEVVVAREKGENLGAIALEGVRADGRAVIAGCAVSLSHHRGSRRTRRGARGGLTRSHPRREVTGKRARVFSHDARAARITGMLFSAMGFQSGERRWKKNPTRSRGKSRLIRQCEVGGCSTGDALLRVADARRNAAPLACSGAGRTKMEEVWFVRGRRAQKTRLERAVIERRTSRRSPGDTSGPAQS